MVDKLVFGIRSCQVPPYPERTKECLSTWGKDAKDLGYTVKVLLGNPNLYSEYYDTQDTLWSRAIDYDTAAISGLRLIGYDRPLPMWLGN